MENNLKNTNDIVLNHMQYHAASHYNAIGQNEFIFNHLQNHMQNHYNAVNSSVQGQIVSIVTTSITIF